MNRKKLSKKEVRNYIIQAICMLLGIIVIAYGSYLSFYFLLAIVIVSITIIPFIIKSWMKQKNSYTQFEHLCNYLTNIIPIFMQKTKIRFTLGELYELCDGRIKTAIKEAIGYIDTTKDDPELLKNGLKKIENQFNNSRVCSVHKFLLSVENTNSSSYKDIADNLNKDVDEWIKRTYKFQKDIKDRRTKILLLCLMTLLMNIFFVYVYVTNEFFTGFVDVIYYQISTCLFIIAIIIIVFLIMTKLTGEWLIEDMRNKNDEKLELQYRNYKKGKQKIQALDIILSSLLFIAAIYFFIVGNRPAAYVLVISSIITITQKARRYNKNKKEVAKELKIEFPMWLREVSLSLGNLTVVNAIENSVFSSSYALRREIKHLLIAINNNPTTIKPYNEFLDEYDIDDVKPSMRILYAVNNVSKSEMKERVAVLIDRNQELLAKTETIRNFDSISGIETIGYLPTVIFSLHIMISMLVMFNYMFEVLGALI